MYFKTFSSSQEVTSLNLSSVEDISYMFAFTKIENFNSKPSDVVYSKSEISILRTLINMLPTQNLF